MGEYSDEFVKGFEHAKRLAWEIVQLARSGDMDQDYRSIAYRILSLYPGEEVKKED